NLSPSRLTSYLARAAIYAAPSLYEPFGMAVLEAAGAGCALVLSDIPSFRENWSGAAILVPSKNWGSWINSLKRLIDDPSLRVKLGQQAQARAAELTADKMGRRYFSSYLEVWQTFHGSG